MIYDYNGHHISLLDVSTIVAEGTDEALVVAVYFTGLLEPTFRFVIGVDDELAMKKVEDFIAAYYEAMETEEPD